MIATLLVAVRRMFLAHKRWALRKVIEFSPLSVLLFCWVFVWQWVAVMIFGVVSVELLAAVGPVLTIKSTAFVAVGIVWMIMTIAVLAIWMTLLWHWFTLCLKLLITGRSAKAEATLGRVEALLARLAPSTVST